VRAEGFGNVVVGRVVNLGSYLLLVPASRVALTKSCSFWSSTDWMKSHFGSGPAMVGVFLGNLTSGQNVAYLFPLTSRTGILPRPESARMYRFGFLSLTRKRTTVSPFFASDMSHVHVGEAKNLILESAEPFQVSVMLAMAHFLPTNGADTRSTVAIAITSLFRTKSSRDIPATLARAVTSLNIMNKIKRKAARIS
jgi:hypothetical protein